MSPGAKSGAGAGAAGAESPMSAAQEASKSVKTSTREHTIMQRFILISFFH